MRYFYHYATSRPNLDGGECIASGTLDCAWMIDSSDRYQDVVRGIAEQIGADVGQFAITSLTLLNPSHAKETP